MILIEENKKKLTQCQKNEKLTKILWILGQYISRHVSKHVTLQCKSGTFSTKVEYFIYTEKNSWSNFTQLCRSNLGHKDIWTSIKSIKSIWYIPNSPKVNNNKRYIGNSKELSKTLSTTGHQHASSVAGASALNFPAAR